MLANLLERVELYFGANDIAPEKKVAIILSVIGAKTYAVLRSLVAPAQPKDKPFAELKTLLRSEAIGHSGEVSVL